MTRSTIAAIYPSAVLAISGRFGRRTRRADGRAAVSGSKCDVRQQETIMPLLFGKLLAAVVVTTVAASIAVALGTVMALIDEADQRIQPDSKAAA